MIAGSAGGATVLLGQLFTGRVRSEDAAIEATVKSLGRVRVANLTDLKTDQVTEFEYPPGQLHSAAMLVKLGTPAGGGVGTQQDIVAFSTLCTHMGADLTYNSEHKLAGPCDAHLTSFDLTRHGMVVAGHATQALPQILLEMDGEEIFAIGILGLLFGYHTNPTESATN